jgi:hypothetical protein
MDGSIQNEKLPLAVACSRALGLRKHASTYQRWVSKGVVGKAGVRFFLQAELIGGQLYTTIENVRRFNELLNTPLETKRDLRDCERSREAHRKSNARRLAALGIVL